MPIRSYVATPVALPAHSGVSDVYRYLRDMIVAGFGLNTARDLAILGHTAKAERVGIFRIYSSKQTDIVVERMTGTWISGYRFYYLPDRLQNPAAC